MKRAILYLGMLVSIVSFGQQYSIDWHKIAGGGGTSTGSTYSLNGTLGQPDTAVMTGGDFGLVGGFWSFIAAVPVPGTPALTLMLSQTNTILVCWPSSSTNFVLQQNANLTGTNWVNVASTPADNGLLKCIAINPSPGALFFRLKK